jgi:hypothetical protein
LEDENGRTPGQDDDNPLPRQSQREASSQSNTVKEENQRFRGTTRSSLIYQVSFTNRQSIYRNAFVELGWYSAISVLTPYLSTDLGEHHRQQEVYQFVAYGHFSSFEDEGSFLPLDRLHKI